MNTLKRIAAITVLVLSTSAATAQQSQPIMQPVYMPTPWATPMPMQPLAAPIIYPGTFPPPILQPMHPIQPVGGYRGPITPFGYR